MTDMPVTRGGSWPIGISPPIGSQSSQAPNTRIIMRPSQKIGIETPKSDTVMTVLSKRESGQIAAKTPHGTPIATATMRAATESWMVTGKAFHTSSKARWLLRSDMPKSPCSASTAKR